MKRLFTFCVAILCGIFLLHAEALKFNATSFAYKTQNDYGYWSDWSNWEYTSILIVINSDNDRINIYSRTLQEYDIYDYMENGYDRDGGETITFKCIDADGVRCDVRIRIERSGNRQLLLD